MKLAWLDVWLADCMGHQEVFDFSSTTTGAEGDPLDSANEEHGEVYNSVSQ